MAQFSPPTSAPTPEEALLRRAAGCVVPDHGLKARVRATLMRRITAPAALHELKEALAPSDEVRARLRWHILASLEPLTVTSLFDELKKTLLTPDGIVRSLLHGRVLSRLQPAALPLVHRPLKWLAAFAVILFVIRVSPFLFLAPRSIADSPLVLLPTRGDVLVLANGIWQPVTQETKLSGSAMVQTQEGEATLVLHDDGVVRLGPQTTVALHDTADRPAPPEHDQTLTVYRGRVWVQGLLPPHVVPLRIVTSQGTLMLHEGSVSVREGNVVAVNVWHRHAVVVRDGQEIPLVGGEQVELWEGNVPRVKSIAAAEYEEDFAVDNLQRDAVHREEIARLQQERRAALAGIPPTSPFYPLKRVAENIDVLLTFGEEARAQKLLDQADTRLNEAAALLAAGESAAVTGSLHEYRQAVLEVATGSGEASLVQFLIRQELLEATAGIAAALPDDESYPLKRAILVTSAVIPENVLTLDDVQHVLLTDAFSAMMRTIERGDMHMAKELFTELRPSIAALEKGGMNLSPDLSRELRASLGSFALALEAFDEEVGGVDQEFLALLQPYLPARRTTRVASLSEEELASFVRGIYGRIFLYKHPRSRWNQLMYEFTRLEGNPDQGRILRRLYHVLPENGLAQYVKTEFERLRQAKSEELEKVL